MLIRDLSKELNVDNKTIIELFTDKKTQASKLTDEEVKFVKEKLSATPKNTEREAVKVSMTKEQRKFNADDEIMCKSITAGELIHIGKSGTNYSWMDAGHTIAVRYDDIISMKFARSKNIYEPRFIIEDDDLLNDPRFADVKELYTKIFSADVEEILNLPNDDFAVVLAKAPKGLKDAVKVTVATRFENGEFDSLQKVQLVEELCGAEILALK